MAKKWTEWWVEYGYIDTKYGLRAEWIKVFKTKEEAEKWAAENTTDGKVYETKCERM